MRSRELNKRVEVYSSTLVDNGFGGNTSTPTLVTTLWCKVENSNLKRSFAAANLAELGTIDTQRSVLFIFRLNPNLVIRAKDHYLRYRNKNYQIGVAPTNSNFEDNYVTMIGNEV